MAQENSDMSTKFSTLNVNAAEFVPSFGSFSAAVVSSINNDSTPAAVASAAPMDTSSVPSTSGTPATTPNSEASVSSSINALNQAGDVPPAESPMQTSPVKTAAAAPVENINIADKIAANNGNISIRTYLYEDRRLVVSFESMKNSHACVMELKTEWVKPYGKFTQNIGASTIVDMRIFELADK